MKIKNNPELQLLFGNPRKSPKKSSKKINKEKSMAKKKRAKKAKKVLAKKAFKAKFFKGKKKLSPKKLDAELKSTIVKGLGKKKRKSKKKAKKIKAKKVAKKVSPKKRKVSKKHTKRKGGKKLSKKAKKAALKLSHKAPKKAKKVKAKKGKRRASKKKGKKIRSALAKRLKAFKMAKKAGLVSELAVKVAGQKPAKKTSAYKHRKVAAKIKRAEDRAGRKLTQSEKEIMYANNPKKGKRMAKRRKSKKAKRSIARGSIAYKVFKNPMSSISNAGKDIIKYVKDHNVEIISLVGAIAVLPVAVELLKKTISKNSIGQKINSYLDLADKYTANLASPLLVLGGIYGIAKVSKMESKPVVRQSIQGLTLGTVVYALVAVVQKQLTKLVPASTVAGLARDYNGLSGYSAQNGQMGLETQNFGAQAQLGMEAASDWETTSADFSADDSFGEEEAQLG